MSDEAGDEDDGDEEDDGGPPERSSSTRAVRDVFEGLTLLAALLAALIVAAPVVLVRAYFRPGRYVRNVLEAYQPVMLFVGRNV